MNRDCRTAYEWPEFQFGYKAFGFYLACNLPLPWLKTTANSGLPEVKVYLGGMPPHFEPAPYTELWYSSGHKDSSGENSLNIFRSGQSDDALYWLKYEDGTQVLVGENASRIWVTWPQEFSLADAATYLLGPVIAILAQLRNRTCLHASAVALDGSMVAILGPKGAGKSTSAAAFARAGYAVAADDIVIVTESDDGFDVVPGCASIRLWPSSVAALFGDPDALPQLTPTWDKRGLNLNHGGYQFQAEPLPLAAAYILSERSDSVEAPYLRPMAGAAALIKIVCNAWGHYNKPPELARQLEILARLSSRIPIRELVAHRDPKRLPDLLELVADDVRKIHSSCENRAIAMQIS